MGEFGMDDDLLNQGRGTAGEDRGADSGEGLGGLAMRVKEVVGCQDENAETTRRRKIYD